MIPLRPVSLLVRLTLWQIKNALRDALTNLRKLVPLALAAVVVLVAAYNPPQTPEGTPILETLIRTLQAKRAEAHAVFFLLLSLLMAALLDRGLAGGTLAYSAAETDYLFLAPLPSRLVLGYKLLAPAPGILLLVLYNACRPVPGLTLSVLPAWVLTAALFACAGGCQNLAVAFDLAYGLGRFVWLRRIFLGCLLLLAAEGILLTRRDGLAGLIGFAEHGLLPRLFYPCRLTVDVVLATRAGAGWWASGQLALFYLLTLGLVLAPRRNFYEDAALATERLARAAQAQREGQWWFRGTKPRRSQSPTSLPPWGQGAWAVAWAHFSAAAKNPLGNYAVPTLVGVVLAVAALHISVPADESGWPDESGWLVGIFAFYYLAATTIGGGIFYFRRALQREPWIRPLPLPAEAVVLAEVLPRTLLALPFYLLCGLILLAFGGPPFALVAGTVLCLPLASLCLSLLQYTIALSYPSQEDKVQAVIAQCVQMVLALLLTPILALFLAIPLSLGAMPGLALSIFAGCCSLVIVFLWRAATRAYRAYPPDGTANLFTKDTLKRLLKPLAIVAVLLLLAVFVGRSINSALHKPPVPPRTVQAHRGDILIQVSETGTIEPVDKVDVKSKAAGRLLSIPIKEGEYVTRGQLIAVVDRSQIDPQLTQFQAQLRQAQARLAQTQAEYALQVQQTASAIAQAQAGLATAKTHFAVVAAAARPQELAQQKEAVDRAQISLDDAKRTQKRRAALLTRGFISQADYDTSQVAVDTAASSLATAKQALALTVAGPRVQDVADAQAQVEAAQVQLQAARANSGEDAVKFSDIAQARASVAQIVGNIQQLQVNIADTRIVAPASGIVLKKYKEPNEIVQSATTGFTDSQSIVATLGSRLQVSVGINEVDIAKVRLGAPATITVDALPGVPFPGSVTQIAPASTNAFTDTSTSGSSGGANSISKFSVKVAFDRYDPRLRSGMSANVAILSQKHSNVVLAPLEAVPFTGTSGQVTVLADVKTQEKRTVTTGLRDDTSVEILSGLHPGDTLVVPPLDSTSRRKSDINGNGDNGN